MEKHAHFSFKCKTGFIDVEAVDQSSGTQLFEVGIINADQELSTYCSNSAFTDPHACSKYVNA